MSKPLLIRESLNAGIEKISRKPIFGFPKKSETFKMKLYSEVVDEILINSKHLSGWSGGGSGLAK